MEEKLKKAWIDVERRIVAFQPFQNGTMVTKPEASFWTWVVELTKIGYRIM